MYLTSRPLWPIVLDLFTLFDLSDLLHLLDLPDLSDLSDLPDLLDLPDFPFSLCDDWPALQSCDGGDPHTHQ